MLTRFEDSCFDGEFNKHNYFIDSILISSCTPTDKCVAHSNREFLKPFPTSDQQRWTSRLNCASTRTHLTIHCLEHQFRWVHWSPADGRSPRDTEYCCRADLPCDCHRVGYLESLKCQPFNWLYREIKSISLFYDALAPSRLFRTMKWLLRDQC